MPDCRSFAQNVSDGVSNSVAPSFYHLRKFRRNSKQSLELIDRKPRIFDDSTHSKRLDWIVARDSQHPLSVIHYDMLALPDYPKPRFFESADCVKMVDSWNFRHDQAAISIS